VEKSELRKLYLQKRSQLGSEETEKLTQAILQNFSSLDFNNLNYIHVFYPIIGKSEFNTLVLSDWLRENHPEIKLVLSKSNTSNHTLSHFIWDSDTRLCMNQWGITEPENGVAVSPDALDLVLVPLLAFDKKGNRIGYGKGFYDRFLAECRTDVKKVGISYFPPEELIEGTNEHDIPLDLCITPEKVWNIN
jgi:5-formyltetrahydrofolate cyclo-ligase